MANKPQEANKKLPRMYYENDEDMYQHRLADEDSIESEDPIRSADYRKREEMLNRKLSPEKKKLLNKMASRMPDWPVEEE